MKFVDNNERRDFEPEKMTDPTETSEGNTDVETFGEEKNDALHVMKSLSLGVDGVQDTDEALEGAP